MHIRDMHIRIYYCYQYRHRSKNLFINNSLNIKNNYSELNRNIGSIILNGKYTLNAKTIFADSEQKNA
jgi:hypothetical protein